MQVAEKNPELLDAQCELIGQLKDIGIARFNGNGRKQATYHAVLEEQETDILWVYADGQVYVDWGALDESSATYYKELWGGLIEPLRRDGTPKNDGCFLKNRVGTVEQGKIVETIALMNNASAGSNGEGSRHS